MHAPRTIRTHRLTVQSKANCDRSSRHPALGLMLVASAVLALISRPAAAAPVVTLPAGSLLPPKPIVSGVFNLPRRPIMIGVSGLVCVQRTLGDRDAPSGDQPYAIFFAVDLRNPAATASLVSSPVIAEGMTSGERVPLDLRVPFTPTLIDDPSNLLMLCVIAEHHGSRLQVILDALWTRLPGLFAAKHPVGFTRADLVETLIEEMVTVFRGAATISNIGLNNEPTGSLPDSPIATPREFQLSATDLSQSLFGITSSHTLTFAGGSSGEYRLQLEVVPS
jgi:hypothetical protein